jgi:hypothetical protein
VAPPSRGNRYDSLEIAKRNRRAKGGNRPAYSKQRRRRKLQKKEEFLEPNVAAVTSLKFHGVTGYHIWNEARRKRAINREYLRWGVYNIRAIDPDHKEQLEARFPDKNFTLWHYLTDILDGGPVNGTWEQTKDGPFIFADGTPNPPKKLRDPPEQNYLSLPTRIVGLLLMSLSLFLTVVVTYLVFYYQSESIIHHNQPLFLYMMLLGTAMLAFSNFFISFDEKSLGVTPQDEEPDFLDTACASYPWFVVLGYILIYGALFMKLWRIDIVLQCNQARRKSVSIKHVSWPVLLMLGASITVLATWAGVEPYQWKRCPVLESEPLGETYGQCESPHAAAFMGVLGAIMIIATLAAMQMAYKTKDIDSKFSESSWAFTTIVLQFQVLAVGVPILIILRQNSADAAYFSKVMLSFIVSVSTVALMFGPKLIPIMFPNFVERWNRTTLRSSIGNRGSHVSGVGTGHTIPSQYNQKGGGKSFYSSVPLNHINMQQNHGTPSQGLSATIPADMSESGNTSFGMTTLPTGKGTIPSFNSEVTDYPGIPSINDKEEDDYPGIPPVNAPGANGGVAEEEDDDYPGIPSPKTTAKKTIVKKPTVDDTNAFKDRVKDLKALSSEELVFDSAVQWESREFNTSGSPDRGSIDIHHPDMNSSMTFGLPAPDEEPPKNLVNAYDNADSLAMLDVSMNFKTAHEVEQLPARGAKAKEYTEDDILSHMTPNTKGKRKKKASKKDKSRAAEQPKPRGGRGRGRESMVTVKHRNSS